MKKLKDLAVSYFDQRNATLFHFWSIVAPRLETIVVGQMVWDLSSWEEEDGMFRFDSILAWQETLRLLFIQQLEIRVPAVPTGEPGSFGEWRRW